MEFRVPMTFDRSAVASEIEAAALRQITEADDEAHRSTVAYSAGRFTEYFKAQCQEAEKRIADECAEFLGPPPVAGDREADG